MVLFKLFEAHEPAGGKDDSWAKVVSYHDGNRVSFNHDAPNTIMLLAHLDFFWHNHGPFGADPTVDYLQPAGIKKQIF